jgi:hypothetical protein
MSSYLNTSMNLFGIPNSARDSSKLTNFSQDPTSSMTQVADNESMKQPSRILDIFAKDPDIQLDQRTYEVRPSFPKIDFESSHFSQVMEMARSRQKQLGSLDFLSNIQLSARQINEPIQRKTNPKYYLGEMPEMDISQIIQTERNYGIPLISRTRQNPKAYSSTYQKRKRFEFDHYAPKSEITERNHKPHDSKSFQLTQNEPLNIQDQSYSQEKVAYENEKSLAFLSQSDLEKRSSIGKCNCPGAKSIEGTCSRFLKIYQGETKIHERQKLFRHDSIRNLKSDYGVLVKKASKNQEHFRKENLLIEVVSLYFKGNFPGLGHIVESMSFHSEGWEAFWLTIHLASLLKLGQVSGSSGPNQIHFGKIDNLIYVLDKELFTHLFVNWAKPQSYASEWLSSCLLDVIPKNQNVFFLFNFLIIFFWQEVAQND